MRPTVLWSVAWFACLAGFVLLGVAVSSRESPGLDLDIARQIQKLPEWIGDLLQVANAVGGEWRLTVLTAVTVSLFLFKRLILEAATLSGSIIPRFLQDQLKDVFDVPRPSIDAVNVRELTDTAAYPSGHVVGTTVFFVLLFLLIPALSRDARLVGPVRCLSVIVVAAVPAARIWVGAHWPTDCLGGLLLAAVWLIPALALYRSVQRGAGRPGQRPQGTHQRASGA